MTLLLDHILVADRKIYICVFSCLMLTMTGYNTYRYETSMMHEPCTIAVAPPSTCHAILSSPPTYDGIGANEYIEWETKIDNIFAQCYMCERRKIKNAISVLTFYINLVRVFKFFR